MAHKCNNAQKTLFHKGHYSMLHTPDFVCLLIYEFWLSLWKIALCSVILLLPLLIYTFHNNRYLCPNYWIIKCNLRLICINSLLILWFLDKKSLFSYCYSKFSFLIILKSYHTCTFCTVSWHKDLSSFINLILKETPSTR